MRYKFEFTGNFIEVFRILLDNIPESTKWAIDGSTSLRLQGVDLVPNDIDILTDEAGAYEIENSLKVYVVKGVKHSFNDKYDSHFGALQIDGVKVEIMGDLRVYRNGEWTEMQNTKTVEVEKVRISGMELPVVSLKASRQSGYLKERSAKK